MRVACFGKVTRDEMMYLSGPVAIGGSADILRVETSYGGMASWGSRVIHNEGHTPVLFGCTGEELPYRHTGEDSEDYLVREGSMYHIRVLIGPDGQRTFFVPGEDICPRFVIDPADVGTLDAVLVDGYSLLPGRNPREATQLVEAARSVNPAIPVVVTLPVSQKIDDGAARHLAEVFLNWERVVVSGGWDEHARLPDRFPDGIVRVVTTGPDVPCVTVTRAGETVHVESVRLVGNPRNTNGAGDVFAAGFTIASAQGKDFGEAIRFAHMLASNHVQRRPEPDQRNNRGRSIMLL